MRPNVTMQVFAKKRGIVAGLAEAIGMLPSGLTVDTLCDGDTIEPYESVMHIHGPYPSFASYETMMLGVIARRTLIATNMHRVCAAASGVPVMFMGARHDDWRVQVGDGSAARVGGAASWSTDANGYPGSGTMPHALLACFNGDVSGATLAYHDYMVANKANYPLYVLVDYNNDVVTDSLRACEALLDRRGVLPAGVRLDTSENLVDKSLANPRGMVVDKTTGVTPALVKCVRVALDARGWGDVKIAVSGGFTPAKIKRFRGSPVDLYGVGSCILGHNNGETDGLYTGFDFTADIVSVDGRPEAKVGRGIRHNTKFIRVTLD